tara:strand:- start:70 stop:381 length:312 start_codon:yes stop_codon:yes gene_type:complete
MSNHQNEMTLERLYDEAIEELRPLFVSGDPHNYKEEDLHLTAVDLAKKRMYEEESKKIEDDYQGVECDQCGEICWEHTSYFGDIRCDECAYEDETYRREMLDD